MKSRSDRRFITLLIKGWVSKTFLTIKKKKKKQKKTVKRMQIRCCEAVELSCVVWSGRKDPAEGWWDCPAGPVMGSESWVYVTQTPVAFQPEIPGNQSGKLNTPAVRHFIDLGIGGSSLPQPPVL